MSIESCRLINLPRVVDSRGSLSFIESLVQIPFEIRRIFFLYDVPREQERGAHAHKTLHQLLIAISGSFDLMVDNGFQKKTITLDRPSVGVHVPPMIWANERKFSPGTVCLVIASDKYQESDYIRNYEEYLKIVRK